MLCKSAIILWFCTHAPRFLCAQIKAAALHIEDEVRRLRELVTDDLIGGPLRNFLETEKRPCLTKPFSLGELRQAVQARFNAV